MTAEQPEPTEQGSVSAEDFKAVFRGHPAGVAVVTCATPNGPAGFTATSVISVATHPAVLAFSVAAGSSSRRVLDTVQSVVVNFLAADQEGVARRFAQREVDRFAGLETCLLTTGEPVLPGTTAWIRGVVEQRVPVGDSLLITVRAVLAHRSEQTEPLVYLDRAFPRVAPPRG